MKLLKIIFFLIGIFFLISAGYGYLSTKSLYLADVLLSLLSFLVFIVLVLKKKSNG